MLLGAIREQSMRQFKRVLVTLAAAGWITGAGAQELKVGLSAEPSAMDPHFHNLTPNNSLTKHIFDRLTDQDENQLIQPALALSWRTTDDTTWEFKLRPGAKFSNGDDFTANDVIYSYCRAPRVENSPSSFGIYTRFVRQRDRQNGPKWLNSIPATWHVLRHMRAQQFNLALDGEARTVAIRRKSVCACAAADRGHEKPPESPMLSEG